MPVMTIAIIAVTCVITIFAFSNDEFLDTYIFSIDEIVNNNEYIRLITSAFLHANWEHLLFNMYSFYTFSDYMEKAYGFPIIVIIYFGSILGGGLFSLIKNRKNFSYKALGASGGVCGIIYASIFLMEGGNIMIFPLPISMPDWVYAVIFLGVTSFALNRKTQDNIGHDAHLGGALTGTVIALIHSPWIIQQEYKLLIGLIVPLIAIPIINKYFLNKNL